MVYIAGAWAPDYGVSNVFSCDPATPVLGESQDGSPARPFSSLQAAIDHAVTLGLSQVRIHLAPGQYPGDLTIPAELDVLLEGAIRRNEMAILGDIHWHVSGAFLSRLALRQLVVSGTIEVLDGVPAASPAVFSADECQLGTGAGPPAIRCVGSSTLLCTITAMSSAGFAYVDSPTAPTSRMYAGNPVVRSVVLGEVDAATAQLYTAGTHYAPECTRVRVDTLRAVHCCLEQNLEVMSTADAHAELVGCTFHPPARQLRFVNAAGLVFFDGLTGHVFDQAGWACVNGTLDGGAVWHGRSVFMGPLSMRGVITPPNVTADLHDYNPVGLQRAQRVRVNHAGTGIELTGIAGGSEGRVLWLHSVSPASAASVDIRHEDARSQVPNRILTPGANVYTWSPGATVQLIYDGASNRWRIA